MKHAAQGNLNDQVPQKALPQGTFPSSLRFQNKRKTFDLLPSPVNMRGDTSASGYDAVQKSPTIALESQRAYCLI